MNRETRVLLGLVGVLLLAVGFAGGYIVGSAGPHDAEAVSAAGGSDSTHTFDGVEVPPHDEAGHQQAEVLLAGQQCPCGDCTDMVLQCKCDTAAEIRGVTAHLFSRGQSAGDVARQINENYGLTIAVAASTNGAGDDGDAQPDSAIEMLEILNK